MKALCSKAASALANNLKFNSGTELDTDFDLSIYETPLRPYDPQTGRFTGVDILAQAYSSLTPYHFAGNNPVSANDPTGALMHMENQSNDEIQQASNVFSNLGYGQQRHGARIMGLDEEQLNDYLMSQLTGIETMFGGGGGGGGGGAADVLGVVETIINGDNPIGGILDANGNSLNGVSWSFSDGALTSYDFIEGFPSFSTLDANYPSPYHHKPDRTPLNSDVPVNDDNDASFLYANQCAIRMSICLLKSGVDISGVRNIWNPGGKTFSSDGNVLGAINLASFLKSKDMLGKPEFYNGTKDDVGTLLAGKTGIIFFQRYNENFGENLTASRSYSNAHIDLWNGTDIKAPYRDQMLNSSIIWFWNVK